MSMWGLVQNGFPGNSTVTVYHLRDLPRHHVAHVGTQFLGQMLECGNPFYGDVFPVYPHSESNGSDSDRHRLDADCSQIQRYEGDRVRILTPAPNPTQVKEGTIWMAKTDTNIHWLRCVVLKRAYKNNRRAALVSFLDMMAVAVVQIRKQMAFCTARIVSHPPKVAFCSWHGDPPTPSRDWVNRLLEVMEIKSSLDAKAGYLYKLVVAYRGDQIRQRPRKRKRSSASGTGRKSVYFVVDAGTQTPTSWEDEFDALNYQTIRMDLTDLKLEQERVDRQNQYFEEDLQDAMKQFKRTQHMLEQVLLQNEVVDCVLDQD